MKLLAIDTSTAACSAALHDGDQILSRYQIAPRQHTQLILPMIDELLSQASCRFSQLDSLSFACGPGSFTGLRVAAGVIQGLAFSHDLPVVAISTLRSIAQRVYQQQMSKQILVCIDARMNEWYWGHYQLSLTGIMQGSDHLSALVDICLPEAIQALALGENGQVVADHVRAKQTIASVVTDCYPHAEAVADLAVYEYEQGNILTAEQAVPTYLRDKVTN